MKWTEEEINIILNNYSKDGINIKGINKTKIAIQHKASRLGIKVKDEYLSKNKSLSHKGKPQSKLCLVRATNFRNPDKYSSYLLGLLWGDGYLNNKSQNYRICIESISSDLKEIEHIFNSTGKWGFRERFRKNRQPQTSRICSNLDLYTYLKENNYEDKATKNSIIQNEIDKNLVHYWWRGYFDADGCIYFNIKNKCTQLSFSSSYEQDWTFVEELFSYLNITWTIKRIIKPNNNKYSMIRTTNKSYCIKFLNYIYQDEIFGFSRKYNKYKELLTC
jgi:hypothetical protein